MIKRAEEDRHLNRLSFSEAVLFDGHEKAEKERVSKDLDKSLHSSKGKKKLGTVASLESSFASINSTDIRSFKQNPPSSHKKDTLNS